MTGNSLPHLLILRQTRGHKNFFIFGQLSGQIKRISAFAASAPANYECDLIHYLHDPYQFSCKIQVIISILLRATAVNRCLKSG
jgi:hypothetical protein